MANYDIAIIGGGIQGVGCAQAAAAAGYSVCILEKDTWGSATSGHSSKLIHGGLRYLETYQFGLVRKALRERRILLDIAAPLVHPVPFYIPVYKKGRRKPWQISIGLSLYSILGGLIPLSRFRVVPEAEWSQLNGLRTEGLQKIYRYWEAQTDDRLFTLAVVRSAESLGAELHEHATFLKAQREKDRDLYRMSYSQNNQVKEVCCRVLINAGGPWAATLQKQIEGAPNPPDIDLVQGSHIVLKGRISDACFYVESPSDRRAVLIMPWYENTLVGTTETAFAGNPDRCQVLDDEIAYLQTAVRYYFPTWPIEVQDLFAGIRVLPKSGKGFTDRSRDTMIQYDDYKHPRLVGLYGGKLTTYRTTSELVVKQLGQTLGDRGRKRDTAKINLEQVQSK